MTLGDENKSRTIGECAPHGGMICRRFYPGGSACTRYGGVMKCLEDLREPTAHGEIRKDNQ